MITLDSRDGADLSRQILNECLSRATNKHNGRGWNKFNAVCCRHNGETIDTRRRGNLLLTSGGIIYYCFNCGFKTGWHAGSKLGGKFRRLLEWFSVSHEDVVKINLLALRIKETQLNHDTPLETRSLNYDFDYDEKPLPDNARPFTYWLENPTEDFLKVLDYICDRGDDVVVSYDFYWSPNRNISNRVIIPFKWKGKIVGWTARSITATKKYRYVNESPPDYLFNTEVISEDHAYIILCEGPFDALAIGGVATLGNHLSTNQCAWINNRGKVVIVLPDREKDGGALVDVALREGWYVSFPKWGVGVKDASAAVKLLGRLYSLWSVINHKDNRPSAISTRRKMLLK